MQTIEELKEKKINNNGSSLCFCCANISWPCGRKLLLRLFCGSLFLCICFSQCWTILRAFFEYPTIISIHDVSPSLVTILPGLTICNNNRISLKRLAQRNETIRRNLASKFGPNWTQQGARSLVDRAEFNNFRDELALLFDKLGYNPKKDAEEATMEQLFGMRPDSEQFIEWLGCARSWQETLDCGRLTRIESITSRRCSTMLHTGAMLNDRVNKPHLFAGPSLEVIKMVLNFEPEDYADLHRQIGARIFFHDNGQVANAGYLDFFVTRGYKYDFIIDRKDTKHLGKPYDECKDYQRENLHDFSERVEPRRPLSMTTCAQNCVVRNVLHRSRCWPPQMPYYRNDSLDPERSIKPCSWHRGAQQLAIFEQLARRQFNQQQRKKLMPTNSSKQEQQQQQQQQQLHPNPSSDKVKQPSYKRMQIYRKIKRFCWSHCVLPCRYTEYSVALTKSAWPTDVNIMFDKTGAALHRRHCCAMIAIKYTHYHYNVHEHMAKFDVANTIGDIGGLLGVWLGVSIVAVYKFIENLIGFSRFHLSDLMAKRRLISARL